MDVRIGVTQSPKEIEVELAEDADVAKISEEIEESVGSGTGVLWLTDRRGRRVAVPAAKVAYVELDPTGDERRVGFGTAMR